MNQFFIGGLILCMSCTTRKEGRQTIPETTDSAILQKYSHPLNDKKDLQVLFDQIGNSRIVLLGEASHGTSEYYYWRSEISKYLIQEKGFNIIAVESDWSEANKIDQFIKGEKKDSISMRNLLEKFNRWPIWLWGNREIYSFVHWLNDFNQIRAEENKIGFYGLDLFSIGESLTYLNSLPDTTILNLAKSMQYCFQPFKEDAYLYSAATSKQMTDCSKEALNLWQAVKKVTGHPGNSREKIIISQNARVVLNGEKYLRIVTKDRATGWNLREQHMAETVKALFQMHDAGSKIIIWAHNTHVGDANYTDMGNRGKTNLGELLRKEYGDKKVFIVGFGSYSGSVGAVEKWGTVFQQMMLPPAIINSWEEILHRSGSSNKIILSKDIINTNLNRWIDQRAIGIIYHPKNELSYIPSVIPKRYDAFIYIDQTTALHPFVPLSVTTGWNNNAGLDF